MQGFPSRAGDSGPFSTRETLGLMRAELTRAARYGYPVTLLLIEVDRLGSLHDLYGVESERRALEAAVLELRASVRASDSLACERDRRIVVLLPHAPAHAVSAVAVRLLEACRALELRGGDRSLRPTLSIGAASVSAGGQADFDAFVASAEQALAFAIRSGGDRFVLHQPAEATIEELRRELEREETRLRGAQARAAGDGEAAPALATDDGQPAPALATRIHALFRALGGHSAALGDLEREVLEAAGEGLEAPRERDPALVARQIASLERRIRRLKALLDATEAELVALARKKGVDPGIASIFRTVQGLRPDQEDFARRQEMLTLIFEANLELRRGDPA
jgi:diguanylate cyclase (GGDEF)-like protein